jgi:hypothetical protein
MYVSGKMRTDETIPRMGRRGIKDNDVGHEFNYDISQDRNFGKCHNAPSAQQ